MTELAWIESAGGPLILVPAALAPAWEGNEPPSGGRVVQATFRCHPDAAACDYDRACDVKDEIGIVTVGDGQAVVLGDEPMATALVPAPDGAVMVRWRWADSEASGEIALREGLALDAQPHAPSFEVRSTPLWLFDSVWPGRETDEKLVLDLPPGSYTVSSMESKPDEHSAFLVHRLRHV